ncbi:MAG: hypothetical protein V1909_01315 [Candidatus Micrarchaeota archaeon]
MQISLKLDGYMEHIINEALDLGIARTKTEALRLGLLELERKLKESEFYQDSVDNDIISAAQQRVREKKTKLYTEKEILGD